MDRGLISLPDIGVGFRWTGVNWGWSFEGWCLFTHPLCLWRRGNLPEDMEGYKYVVSDDKNQPSKILTSMIAWKLSGCQMVCQQGILPMQKKETAGEFIVSWVCVLTDMRLHLKLYSELRYKYTLRDSISRQSTGLQISFRISWRASWLCHISLPLNFSRSLNVTNRFSFFTVLSTTLVSQPQPYDSVFFDNGWGLNSEKKIVVSLHLYLHKSY